MGNFNLIKQLKELPHPHIILASPPCESWSGADCAGKMFRKITKDGHWEVKNRKYYDEYNLKCHPVKRRYFYQKEEGRILGESTIGATIKIIETFQPKIWIVENPQTSKMWKFQEYHWNFYGEMNLTFYSSYDSSFSLKPTIFKSNKKFNLLQERKKGDKNHMLKGSYSKRSSIPEALIKDIISQCLGFLNE